MILYSGCSYAKACGKELVIFIQLVKKIKVEVVGINPLEHDVLMKLEGIEDETW